MKHAVLGLVVIVAILLRPHCASAQHRLAVQGNGKLAIVERDGSTSWEFPWEGIHDISYSAAGTFMVQQGASKVAEIDIAKRAVVWSYDSATANGNVGKRVE